MTLPSITLGDGLVVPAQGFGTMSLTHAYGPADERESIATLHAAIDAGAALIDTADIYGDGANEELVGRVVRARRDEVVLASKFGFLSAPDADGLRVRGDAPYLRAAVERSLRRLGVERIDLYYYHRVDPRVPIEDTVGAMADLVAAGLIGHVGLSEATAAELARAHTVHPIAAVQSEWSIWSRDVEDHVIPAAVDRGVGFVAYAPLGRGFLTGAVSADSPPDPTDSRRNFPRFDAERLRSNEVVVDAVRRRAADEGVSPARLALGWLYDRAERLGVALAAIPGTRRADRVRENVSALGHRPSPQTVAELDRLASLVEGDRARDPLTISQGRERIGDE
ncbi:aldo/keto reductase [Microbacterium sp. KSW4-11]|uniref:Aldo/keto reductase n=1 Tax=Microbacterium gawkjiense TaxID=3067309 RepID=A0ABU3G993_9MICO|nr:aldo/keto reductase [Microbacterium sp. KSW4-11]MDT3316369.1 aldo/keto reductase [Microbacterium sp. KSW4-11]